MNLKAGLLILASVTVTVIALMYGLSPTWFAENLLSDTASISRDQAHILRAIMMLYISLGLFWLICSRSNRLQDSGILVLCIFCGGLAVGRIISILVDGVPSPVLIVYLGMELGMAPICLLLLGRKDQDTSSNG